MSRVRMLISVFAAAAVTGAWAAPAATAAARTAGGWGRAVAVPGLRALNAGGDAQVAAVSCSATGNCAAGGSYQDGSGNPQGHQQAWVASERNGRWHRAIEVPGSGALNAGGYAYVYSVSCGSAGNCAAGGFYTERSGHQQAWVASEQNGSWRRAVEVPGSAALDAGGNAQVSSVSCASAGNCAAGGSYFERSGHIQAWVASERKGRWHWAIDVPGLRALNAGGSAGVVSVSCVSAGNCAAGGNYVDGTGHYQAWVASERNGRWHWAIEVPGSGTLNAGRGDSVRSVSCGSAGNCAAVGTYIDVFHHFQAWVASENNGRWHRAIEVPGSAALNAGGNANVLSVSCGSAGNCATGGNYEDGTGHSQAWVASERNGRWHQAIEVPGSGGLNIGGDAYIGSVSCPPAGKCAAIGTYKNASGAYEAYVVSQT